MKNTQFLAYQEITTEQYNSLLPNLDPNTFYLFTDNATYRGAIGGQLLSSMAGVSPDIVNQTYLTATDEIGTLPASINIGAVGADNTKNLLVNSPLTGEANLSAFPLTSAGIFHTDASGNPALDFDITTNNTNFALNTGTGNANFTAATLALTGNETVSGTLGVTGASTLAGVSATSVSTTGAITSGTTLTASNGFTQTTGAHNVTTGNTASTINTGTAALNVTASTLALTGNETVSGTLGVNGSVTSGGLLTASNGFTQNSGAFSVITGNTPSYIQTGTADFTIDAGTCYITTALNVTTGNAAFVLNSGTADSYITAGTLYLSASLNLNTGNTAAVINTGTATTFMTTANLNLTGALNVTSNNQDVNIIAGTANTTLSGRYLYLNQSHTIVTGQFVVTSNNQDVVINTGTGNTFLTTANLSLSGPLNVTSNNQDVNINTGIATASLFGTSLYLNQQDINMPNITTSGSGTALVSSGGRIYLLSSSSQFKKDIEDITIETSRIYDLRPVNYTHIDSGEKCFGMIAEEVERIIPELVCYEKDKAFSINYSLLSVLLLNEMKKLKSRIDELEARI